MADPKSLTDFATREVNNLKAALKAANQEVTDRRDALVAAEGALRTATENLSQANVTLAEIRRKLALIGMPADGEPLLTALKDAIVDQRGKSAALAAADLKQAKAAAGLDQAQAALPVIVTRLSAAEAAAKATADAKKRRDDAVAAINAKPLKDIKRTASSALASAEHGRAKARIEGALPEPLRKQMTARADQALDAVKRAELRQAAAQEALDAFIEETGLATDTLPRLRRADARAEADLLVWVDGLPRRLSAAVASLKRLAGLDLPALTKEQKASIDADGDTRSKAAAAEEEWDKANGKVADALNALAIERLKARVADPKVDLATKEADATTELGKAKKEWDDAKVAFGTEDGKFTAAMKKTMTNWRAAVPDSLWLEVESFSAADKDLTELTTASVTPFDDALKEAEDALLAALIDDAKRRKRADVSATQLAAETAIAVSARARSDAFRAAAVRSQPMLEI